MSPLGQKLSGTSYTPPGPVYVGHVTAGGVSETLFGWPIVYDKEEPKSMIFDDDDEGLTPEVMQSDWIKVAEIGSGDENPDLFEAKRLRLSDGEIEYLTINFGIEKAQEIAQQCEKLWIVRANILDSDQKVVTDKELKKNFKSVVVNGNAERTGRTVKLDNQYFWTSSTGFVSFDDDLKLDGAENLFF